MEDRFEKLRDHILNMRAIQESNIAQLALYNPDRLSGNPEFELFKDRFLLLDRLSDKADEIGN